MQAVGLADGDLLALGVNNEDGLRQGGHVADTAEVLLELVKLLGEQSLLLLGQRVHAAVLDHGLELLHAGDTGAHGHEVGEHAAKPALVDVGHVGALGLGLDGLLGLLLGTHEEDLAALGSGLTQESVGLVSVNEGLLEVEDVDAVALAKDVRLHLGVPAAGLVTVVAACVEKGLDSNLSSHV